jgi:hypothetical protein
METKVRFVRQALSAAVWVGSAGRVDFSGLRIEAFILIPGPRGAPFHPVEEAGLIFCGWNRVGLFAVDVRFTSGQSWPLQNQPP